MFEALGLRGLASAGHNPRVLHTTEDRYTSKQQQDDLLPLRLALPWPLAQVEALVHAKPGSIDFQKPMMIYNAFVS